MSDILTLNGVPPRTTKRANDFATLADVAMVSQQEVIKVFGPLAQLCTELAQRVMVLEDQLGITAPDLSPRPPPASDGTVSPDHGDID